MGHAKQDGGEKRPEGPAGPSGGELFDAILGWNSRFFRTVFDSLVRPVPVARAALASDTTRYTSALRLFIFLYGLLMGLAALIGGPVSPGLAGMTQAGPDDLEQWLAGGSHTLVEIEDGLAFWFGVIIWPITAISSSFYILLLKAYAPNRTLYGHLLIYLITNNGAIGVQILLMVGLAPWVDVLTAAVISTSALLLVYLAITARVIFALYAQTVLGGMMKLLGVVLVLPISIVISSVLQFAFVVLYLQIGYDLSLFQLIAIQAGDTP